MKKTKAIAIALLLTLGATTAASAADYTVSASVLNVRSGASINHKVVGKLVYGDVVDVMEITGDWAKVRLGMEAAFVHKNYIAGEGEELPVSGLSKQNADEIIAFSKKYLGYKYAWGGSSPKAGFDCGGLIRYVFNNFGANFPMGAGSQYRSMSTSVKKSDLQKGDIVYFSSPKSSKIAHTGIYIDDGKFIHASSPGDVVKINTLLSGYYNKYYYGAKRILK